MCSVNKTVFTHVKIAGLKSVEISTPLPNLKPTTLGSRESNACGQSGRCTVAISYSVSQLVEAGICKYQNIQHLVCFEYLERNRRIYA